MAINANQQLSFSKCVDDIINCKLIIVDKHIASLLRCVAKENVLTACISDTLKNSSYVTEFSRARVTLTRPDGTREARLKLPADKNRLFTFVVCLLMEIDSGRRNFIDFLKEYYYNVDSNISYEQFVSAVIKPFKKAGESLLKVDVIEDIDNQAQLQAERYFFAEKVLIPLELTREILSKLEDIRQLLNNGVTFDSLLQQRECIYMCNALTHAIHLNNAKIIQIVYVGFKNTLAPIKVLDNEVAIVTSLILKIQ